MADLKEELANGTRRNAMHELTDLVEKTTLELYERCNALTTLLQQAGEQLLVLQTARHAQDRVNAALGERCKRLEEKLSGVELALCAHIDITRNDGR